MKAVGVTAQEVVREVRRQFEQFPGILQNTQKPEYGTCVAIVTQVCVRVCVCVCARERESVCVYVLRTDHGTCVAIVTQVCVCMCVCACVSV